VILWEGGRGDEAALAQKWGLAGVNIKKEAKVVLKRKQPLLGEYLTY